MTEWKADCLQDGPEGGLAAMWWASDDPSNCRCIQRVGTRYKLRDNSDRVLGTYPTLEAAKVAYLMAKAVGR